MTINENSDTEITGCGFNSFKESREINNLINQLRISDLPHSIIEKNVEKFKFIVSQYQDQPHLLDPFLEDIIGKILAVVSDVSTSDDMKNNAFKYLFLLMSVKTYKRLVTYLPHEVIDLLPVLRMLEKQDPTDLSTWETRYVLLIWLSIISKIPFPLSRLETSSSVDPSQTILVRILELCKRYCLVKDSCLVAAVFLVSSFLTRSDVKKLYLEEMIMWCLKCLRNDPLSYGPLAVLASMLKHNSRDDLKPYCQILFDNVIELNFLKSPNSLIGKYAIKIIQRVGLVLLKPKFATWKYQKSGQKINLLSDIQKYPIIENIDVNNSVTIDNDDQDVPTVLEEIIEHLIQGLRNKSIDIRWLAAKGIGKITSRLPVDLADEVVGFVLNLFSDRELDSAWHGGCLALAELGRRGLLLPHRLSEVIPVIVKALLFDEPRVNGSLGSAIRDAACYVCWSFARAFEPHIIQPYVQKISATLLMVACFDREINCRRAASAAFQENVGRQGNFPHGIDIVTVADYFEVGTRNQAYLKVSVHICQYEEYTIPMIDHLTQRKINHWDTTIREIAAKALYNLTPLNPKYMIKTVLPILSDSLDSIDLNVRHGSVLAIAEIIEALYLHFNQDIASIISITELEKYKKIIGLFKTRGQFKGLGGELMKQACCTFIRKSSLVHFPIHSSSIVDEWQDFLEDCLNHEVSIVKLKAAEAHTHFFTEYYEDNYKSKEKRHTAVERYLYNLKSNHENQRIGFAQAIGYFPTFILLEKLEDILTALIDCSHFTKETFQWAESRKNSLQSITMIIKNLHVENDKFQSFILKLYECYLFAMKEYTVDSRGDIGAWVREAAMVGLYELTTSISQSKLITFLSESLMTQIIGEIAQQAIERIDRTRIQAGKIFYTLLYHVPEIPNIPHHDELKKIFPQNECKDNMNWMTELDTFPRFIKMLNYQPYIENILRGIIFSVGGLSESLVKHSSTSLFSYLNEIDEVRLQQLFSEMLNIFDKSHGNERMIKSILTFLDRLLSSGCIQSILDNTQSQLPKRMLTLVKREKQFMTNTKLIMSTINVFCQLLQAKGSVGKQAFVQLSILLCNKFQVIRKTTALRLYEALTLYGEDMDIKEDNLSEILSGLNETDWGKSPDTLRPIRNNFCKLADVNPPIKMKENNDS
ncbi:GSCOCG00011035001-RA-CDS [Cotesia congregata]|uniref:Tubulin-specific chaperone D n=1 Tax=Cotesia congregata TaxID=51543 RepID=A0A8J2HQ30_COTCN|nr:GSCOCG00011035001-RA-CDS [Cotesia congregata]CAG5108207.1 Similar to Tbcd: Tubulin-specific chaperone D (Mus musculus) [Cotesia congregata]